MKSSFWFALLVLCPTAALAASRPAAVYPFESDGASASDVAIVEAGLRALLAKHRPDAPFTLAAGPALKATCGPVSERPGACLAAKAGTGIVLGGRVSRTGKNLFLGLYAFDAAGVTWGPVHVSMPRGKADPAVLDEGLRLLANRLSEPVAAPVPEPAPSPEPAPAPVAVTEPPPVPAPVLAPPVAPVPWRKQPHPWLEAGLAGGGVLALGGSFLVWQDAKAIDADLRARYGNAALRPADFDTFQTLHGRIVTTNVLLVTGLALVGAAGGLFGHDVLSGTF